MKIAKFALAAILCTGALAIADEAKKMDSKMAMKSVMCKGTITKIDNAGKMMMMKDAAGKESTCYWDDKTKVMGEMKEGMMASVKCRMDGDKMMAESVKMMTPKMESKKKM